MLPYHTTQKPYYWAMQLFLLLLLESLMLLDKRLLNIIRHHHSVSTASTSDHSLSVGDCWWLRCRLLRLSLLFDYNILNMLKLGVGSTGVACWSISYLKRYLAIRRLISTADLCRRCRLYLILKMLITRTCHCQRHVSLIFMPAIIQLRVRFCINMRAILDWKDWVHRGIWGLRFGLPVIKPMLL
jgi:hypothetical protein